MSIIEESKVPSEEDSDDDDSTVLETELPSMEYDKKRDIRITKSFPAELRSHFLRLYNDDVSPIKHGFTFEMQQAAFQMLCLEVSTLTLEKTTAYCQFPPSDFFLERCKAATRMRKTVAKYKWQKGLYPPVGTSETPPTESQWKVSEAGKQFMMENPNGKTGVDTALNNLVSLLVDKQNI